MKIDVEKLLADYGLKVGDKVFIKEQQFNPHTIVVNFSFASGYALVDADGGVLDIGHLFCEWKKVEPKKTFGDLKCRSIACYACPLRCVNCKGDSSNSIREKWIETLKKYPQLEPMREYIETELNKEVGE